MGSEELRQGKFRAIVVLKCEDRTVAAGGGGFGDLAKSFQTEISEGLLFDLRELILRFLRMVNELGA
jgi:hypothetical protein